MKILYLNEDKSAVHHELCQALQQNGAEVTMLLLERVHVGWGGDAKYNLVRVNPHYNTIRYRLDFFYKEKVKWQLITTAVDVESYDMIYASTLFSDGAFALRAFKQYGIPYVAAIRSTDLTLYSRWMPHTWHIGRQVAENAKMLIAISPSLKDSFKSAMPFKGQKSLVDKCVIIPNGINAYWIENSCSKSFEAKAANDFVCVSTFLRRKNIPLLIVAFAEARQTVPDIRLHIVGEGGDDTKKILGLVEKYDFVHYHGKINDKDKLQELYRQCDAFVLVSHGETFGLVYLEALSQGLPIIYSKGTGVDGIFDRKVGECVDAHKKKEIRDAIVRMATDMSAYQPLGDSLNRYDWKNVAGQMVKSFKVVLPKCE